MQLSIIITAAPVSSICPLLYCKSGDKTVSIGDDPSKQCTSNRTGVLCGACKENFSLAIGSFRCIECSNNHNVALLLAFFAAGVFLVFLILHSISLLLKDSLMDLSSMLTLCGPLNIAEA